MGVGKPFTTDTCTQSPVQADIQSVLSDNNTAVAESAESLHQENLVRILCDCGQPMRFGEIVIDPNRFHALRSDPNKALFFVEALC